MKYCIGLFLLLTSSVVPQNVYTARDNADEGNAPANAQENIKKNLMAWFATDGIVIEWKTIQTYGKTSGISDDTLRAVLMDIYKSFRHLERNPFKRGEPHEITEDKRKLSNAIEWLGYYADEPTKRLLLDIASDDTIARDYRIPAITASIQCAGAQQVRDVLLRFLIDMKVKPYSAYLCAIRVHDESEDDPQKREAILASLMVVLAREEDKIDFASADKKLAERSKEYATSSQRLAMLQRMSKLPPSPFDRANHDISDARKSFRFRLFKTNVSTNMTELMARDFSKPVEVKKTKGE